MRLKNPLEDYYNYLQKEYEELKCVVYEDSYGNIQFISESDNTKLTIAKYLIDRPKTSVRGLSREFGIPKSTIHEWLTNDLKYLDDDVYVQCKNILKKHKVN